MVLLCFVQKPSQTLLTPNFLSSTGVVYILYVAGGAIAYWSTAAPLPCVRRAVVYPNVFQLLFCQDQEVGAGVVEGGRYNADEFVSVEVLGYARKHRRLRALR